MRRGKRFAKNELSVMVVGFWHAVKYGTLSWTEVLGVEASMIGHRWNALGAVRVWYTNYLRS